jgi:hypothetical protein
MNEVPPVSPAPAVPPIPGQRKSWARSAALCSVSAPVVACAFGLSSSQVPTRILKMVLAGAGTTVVLAGFILAIPALVGSLKQGRKGDKGLAVAGLAVNGAILLGTVALLPALVRVARVWNAGYTVREMMAMPQVIRGSRVILNEPLGFRIEVPGEFLDNPQPRPPRMLYSFLCPDMKGDVTCINIERLGGPIRQESLGSEFDAGIRSQLPPGARIERASASWKTHELDAFGSQFSMGGRALCAWVVQVPLAREAIQVGVGGPAESSEECHQLLNQLLTGLQGRSNWGSPPARMTHATSSWSGPHAGPKDSAKSIILPWLVTSRQDIPFRPGDEASARVLDFGFPATFGEEIAIESLSRGGRIVRLVLSLEDRKRVAQFMSAADEFGGYPCRLSGR